MILARVLGNVVASHKHPAFQARKLLVVQPVDEAGKAAGSSFLAADERQQAGPGDLVLVLREGNGIRQTLAEKNLPIRSLIMGIVDTVTPLGSP